MGKFKVGDVVQLDSPLVKATGKQFLLRVMEVDMYEADVEIFRGMVLIADGFSSFKPGRKVDLPVRRYEVFEDNCPLNNLFAALTKLEQTL